MFDKTCASFELLWIIVITHIVTVKNNTLNSE